MLESHSHAAASSSFVEMRGSYVFAVALDAGLSEWSAPGEDEPVEYVDHGDLVAISSPIDLSEKGATTEMKQRHFRTLEALMPTVAHVPFRPGMTFGGAEAIRTFLDDYERLLHEEMERLGNASEHVVRLSWDVADPVAHLADQYEELAELRGSVGEGASPADVARKLSRRWDHVLEYERRNYSEVLYRRLAAHCREMRSLEHGDDAELARIRCLIGRDAFSEFEKELYEVADDLGTATVFDLTEPEPPLAFLDDRLEM